MKDDVTRTWLIKIAEAVKGWPPPGMDDPGVAMTTPAGAMIYSARTIRDDGERAAVLEVLPKLTTDDFAAAARQIRDAAERLC